MLLCADLNLRENNFLQKYRTFKKKKKKVSVFRYQNNPVFV